MLTLEELRADVDAGRIDTVVMAMTDMQGRLQGKRLDAHAFARDIAEHGAEGCNYLLGVDVDMTPQPGFAMTSWERGYGDFVFRPDLSTLRRASWLEGTALVLCDLEWHDGTPVAPSPRQILRRQLDRLADRGWQAMIGSELEFILFRETYSAARAKGYRGLVPANEYNVDYSILGTTMVEDVLRPIRLHMRASGLEVEDSKGECNLGQHEVNFRYRDALRMADEHAIYKTAAKEIAHQHGAALTFIAKYDEREGNSCHIHCSFWDGGTSLFPAADGHAFSPLYALVRRGPDRAHGGARVLLRAERQLVQALRVRLVRADRAGLGPRQPHLRLPRRRARQGDAAGEPRGRRRRQPVPRLRGHHRGGPRRHRPRAASSVRPSRATPTTPTCRACRRACTRRSAVSRARRSRARRSATRSSTTT